jgi:hypothetical protein
MAAIRQDINVGLIAFVGVVSSMILLITVVGVQAWFAFETDRVLEERYAHDRNVDWIALKQEQYDNIGDPVGNGTIYAAHEQADVEIDPLSTWRFADESRTKLVAPIHVAMAELARRNGHDVSVAEMIEIDRDHYVHLVNNAYRDPQSYVTDLNAPQAD